jgi:hypothetical protein
MNLVHFNSTRACFIDEGAHYEGGVLATGNFPPIRTYARTYNSACELGYQIQIGSKLYPEYRCMSNAEAWYHLAKTLKHQNTNEHGLEIEPHAYFNHEFIIGQNFEKVEGASFTGINTKMGDLMTIKLYNVNDDHQFAPNKIYVTLVGDQIMNISDTGIQVFD